LNVNVKAILPACGYSLGKVAGPPSASEISNEKSVLINPVAAG